MAKVDQRVNLSQWYIMLSIFCTCFTGRYALKAFEKKTLSMVCATWKRLHVKKKEKKIGDCY